MDHYRIPKELAYRINLILEEIFNEDVDSEPEDIPTASSTEEQESWIYDNQTSTTWAEELKQEEQYDPSFITDDERSFFFVNKSFYQQEGHTLQSLEADPSNDTDSFVSYASTDLDADVLDVCLCKRFWRPEHSVAAFQGDREDTEQEVLYRPKFCDWDVGLDPCYMCWQDKWHQDGIGGKLLQLVTEALRIEKLGTDGAQVEKRRVKKKTVEGRLYQRTVRRMGRSWYLPRRS